MLFPALRWMSWALTVLPLTVMSSLAMMAAVLPAVIRLPLASSVTVSAWSFHPVLPRLILIPTALFLLMALSVFWFFCMSLAFIPACRAYRAFSRPSPTSPALFTGAAMSLAALSIDPNILSSLNKCMTILIIAQSLFYAKHDPSLFPVPLPLLSLPALFLKNFPSINYAKFLSHPV